VRYQPTLMRYMYPPRLNPVTTLLCKIERKGADSAHIALLK